MSHFKMYIHIFCFILDAFYSVLICYLRHYFFSLFNLDLGQSSIKTSQTVEYECFPPEDLKKLTV